LPPQPYVDRWIRAAFRITHESSNVIVGMNFLGPVGRPTELSLISLCNNLATNILPGLMGLMHFSYTCTLIEATDRYAIGGAYGSFVPLTSNVGTKSGDATPANVAAVVSWRTGLAGRRARGRTYFPGWTDGDFNGSTLTSANVSALGTLAQSMITYAGPIGTAVDFSVLSLVDDVLRPINGYAIDAVADSQRRRLPGRGF